MKNTKNSKLRELSQKELLNIDGGDWIENLGRGTHKAWCSFKNGVANGFRNMMTSTDTPAMG